MKVTIKVSLASIFFLAVFFALFSAADSKSTSSDRLYALKLDSPPNEFDWENAQPFIVVAKNGNLHELHKAVDVDADSVHTSTASCHHAAPIAPPVTITLKAYYTKDELFLKVKWLDLTKDDAMFEYEFSDDKWNTSKKLEDALGIMWDLSYGKKPFNCSIACHATDWKLKDYSLVSKFRMGIKGSDMVDLWNWSAYRTNTFNFADDRYINEDGVLPDTPSRIYFYNTDRVTSAPVAESARDITPLSEGDTPVYDYNGMKIADGYWMLTGKAPGIRIVMPNGNRADVRALGAYEKSKWEVTFSRALINEDNKDVTFNVKRDNIYKFGLAVFDNTLTNHYAVEEPVELVFVDANKVDAKNN